MTFVPPLREEARWRVDENFEPATFYYVSPSEKQAVKLFWDRENWELGRFMKKLLFSENELMFKDGQTTLTGKDEGLHINLDRLKLKAGRNLVISAQNSQSEI